DGVREALQATLAGRRDVRLAILFGSVARDAATADSDVDLAVEVGPGVDLGALAAQVSLVLGREVDFGVAGRPWRSTARGARARRRGGPRGDRRCCGPVALARAR